MDVSVITINFNNAAGLEQTIASVESQTCRDSEYIVIDGGSSDESKQVIATHAQRLAYWVSERDHGVFDAMNKGIRKASGTYVLFLNSGDYFNSPNVLDILLSSGDGRDIVYGDLVLQDGGRQQTKTYPDDLTFDYFRRESLPHPCSLIRRSLFSSVGPYDENLKLVADWAFFMNAICLHHATYQHVHHPIAVFNTEGLSSQPANRPLLFHERESVLARHYGAFLADYREYDAQRRASKGLWFRVGRKVDKVAQALGGKVRPAP